MDARVSCSESLDRLANDVAHELFRRRAIRRFAWTAIVVGMACLPCISMSVLAQGPAEDFGTAFISDDTEMTVPDRLENSAGTEAMQGASLSETWNDGEMTVDPSTGSLAGVGGSFTPAWDLQVDALMLWQGNAQSLPLFLNNTDGGTAYNAQDLQTEMAAGVRVGAIRAVGERYAIEGNYFQARPFDATGYAPASGGQYTLTNTGDLVFSDIESATVTSSGWIQSAEVNWRKNECWSPITWLAGFRWVELNSQANIDYQFANTDPDAYGSGSINTNVGNNLYGGQMGADMRLWNKGGRWRANAVGKAGVFYNAASFQRSTAGYVTNAGESIPLGTVAATADQTSFFGEVGLNSTYWITNWLAWRAGYTVMWAAGVAVAPEQFPLNNFGGTEPTSINTNGSVLLHGVTTGIEARW